ncbi:unnamed protein product [Rhodiola kirilowii]
MESLKGGSSEFQQLLHSAVSSPYPDLEGKSFKNLKVWIWSDQVYPSSFWNLDVSGYLSSFFAAVCSLHN